MEILTFIIFFLNFKNKNKWSKNVEKYKKKSERPIFFVRHESFTGQIPFEPRKIKKNFVLAPLAQNFSMTSCFVLTPPSPPKILVIFGHDFLPPLPPPRP